MEQLDKENILKILEKNEHISHIRDVDSLLDRVLWEARAITNADAGSIYLLAGEKQLTIEYVQNDTLRKRDPSSNKHVYSNRRIPMDNESIAGYVGLNRTALIIDDVYQLDDSVPYTFNRSFDDESTYHTQSMLTVPLISSRDKITGVLQIINAKTEDGRVVPFSKEDETLVTLFANQAAVAIERAKTTREVILRMIKIAEMRDPEETGAHVNRVGSFAIEIYSRWAAKRMIPEKEIKRMKDLLRIAAMLHDVGKVAISDTILKKKNRLDDHERNVMKLHTIYGARLFKDQTSDWDEMAAEIALNHHEKWDGSGYPGYITNLHAETLQIADGKKGEDIPLSARIVALADVYDALMSKRTYKNSWTEEKTLKHIESEKGKHFDPEVVDAFIEIYDVIKAIRLKYCEEPDQPESKE